MPEEIEKLLRAALHGAHSNRDAFLRDACAGDAALQPEVRSQLRGDGTAASARSLAA
jgi:hypothetical protein